MAERIRAEVLNAFLKPALDLLRAHLRESGIGRMTLGGELPAPPQICVDVLVSGSLKGPVRWTFDERLAGVLAAELGLGTVDTRPSSAECLDALAEAANIIAGNATGALEQAGYRVELQPPVTVVLDGRAPSIALEDVLHVTLRTPAGDVRMSFGLRESGGNA